jgi:uncharacterized membrane protein
MSSSEVLLLAFLIGVIAGLRSLTAPAVVAYGAHKGWLNLSGTRLAWMGALWALIFFVLLAIVELITDQLPSTPPRTKAPGLIARILMGGLAGACVAVAGAGSLMVGAVLGIVGALVGTFGGYQARTGLVRALKVPDFVVACVEDFGGDLWRAFYRFAVLSAGKIGGCCKIQTPVLPPIRKWQVAHCKVLKGSFNRATVD